MVTGIGAQTDFYDALESLIDMDRDAVCAYDAALARFERPEYREKITQFRNDHLAHVDVLTGFLKKSSRLPAKKTASVDKKRSSVTQDKDVVSKLMGDRAILHAMRSNELDSNTVYNRLIHRSDIPDALKSYLKKAYQEENNHLIWIEQALDDRSYRHNDEYPYSSHPYYGNTPDTGRQSSYPRKYRVTF
jgi:rubrerythrin